MTREEFIGRLTKAITPEPSYRGCVLLERDKRLRDLREIDLHLRSLAEVLHGMAAGRARENVLRSVDVWLDRRLALTNPTS